MTKLYTKNFRIQVWLETMPDKLLLGTVSICAQDKESALLIARNHIKLLPVAEDHFSWEIDPDLPRELFVQEPRADYIV